MRILSLLLIGLLAVAPATAHTQQQRTSMRADLQGCWYGGSIDGRTISRSPRDSAFTAIPTMVELGPRSRVPADSATGPIVRPWPLGSIVGLYFVSGADSVRFLWSDGFGAVEYVLRYAADSLLGVASIGHPQFHGSNNFVPVLYRRRPCGPAT